MKRGYTIAISKGDVGYRISAPNLKDITLLLGLVAEELKQ